jgi:two-component system OmpR family sensor kinase
VSPSSQGYVITVHPNLDEYAAPDHAAIKVLTPVSETVIAHTAHAPNLGREGYTRINGDRVETILKGHQNIDDYRVESVEKQLPSPVGGDVVIQYARPLSDVQGTIARVELLLVLGTLAGTGLALLAGAMIARRAMQPITTLTTTAAEIARTRDSSATMPQSEADDEVAELARTLQGMLHSLDDAHAETEAMLARQRRFVADASHELRTPLTSVLANLELLAESLHGESGEAARSALRSSRRMRRLVADLLLLARTDVPRDVAHEPVDLAQVALDAAAELGPLSGEHDLSIDALPAVVQGDHDELFRLTLNLIENALRHTPPGTAVRVSTGTDDALPAGRLAALLVVEDNGPGVPAELAPTLFERFVRGAGDHGGSFGLGLAIVRAVAESHGGSVALEPAHPGVDPPGARFTVRLPLTPAPATLAGQPAALRAS